MYQRYLSQSAINSLPQPTMRATFFNFEISRKNAELLHRSLNVFELNVIMNATDFFKPFLQCSPLSIPCSPQKFLVQKIQDKFHCHQCWKYVGSHQRNTSLIDACLSYFRFAMPCNVTTNCTLNFPPLFFVTLLSNVLCSWKSPFLGSATLDGTKMHTYV